MKKTSILSFIAATLLASSCTKYVTISFKPPRGADNFETASLKKYLKENAKPAILLRTPAAQSDAFSNPGLANTFYNNIEKEFLKSGYTVRDRAIFERVLTQSQSIDYSKMSELTNTDIIVEIVGFEKMPYYTHDVTTNKGKIITYPECEFGPYEGWRVDIKVIMVKENSIVGAYTFYYTPDVEGNRYTVSKKHCTLPLYSTGEPSESGARRFDVNVKMERISQQIGDTIMGSVMNVKQ